MKGAAPPVPPLRGPGWSGSLAASEQLRQQLWQAALAEAGERLCPAPEDVFAAFDLDFERVCVIIIGQDPYPNPAHAVGRAFAVPPGTRPLPPTLRNILAEVSADASCVSGVSPLGDVSGASPADSAGRTDSAGHRTTTGSDLDPSLNSWSEQGVLLLNRTLTCEAGLSLAHEGLGWQRFTDAVITAAVNRNAPLVGILWGRHAQETRSLFRGTPVIEAPHPSPLSAARGFFGSRPFSRCNQLLQEQGHQGIRWVPEGR